MQFLNVTHPDELKSRGAQVLVRKNATKSQHRNRRQVGGFRHFAFRYTTPKKPTAKRLQTVGNIPRQTTSNIRTHGARKRNEFRDTFAVEEGDLRPPLPPIARTPIEQRYSSGAMAFKTMLLQDSDDTVGKCLLQMNTQVSSMLSQFLAIINHHTPTYEQRFGCYGFNGVTMKDALYPFIFTHAAPMAASLLMATIYLLIGRGEDPSTNSALLQLRGFVMKTIQTALIDNTDLATSDQLVCAVIFLAKCDAMHGWSTNHATHMSGLLRMVNLRGGQKKLGLDGILALIVLWFDSETAHMLGTEPCYDYEDALHLQVAQAIEEGAIT